MFDALLPGVAEILSAVEIPASSVVELFGHGVKDADFLPQLNRGEDIFVTHDRHIQTRPAEESALKGVGVKSLFFGPWWANKNRWEQAKWLINTWEKVHEQAQRLRPGQWAWVRSDGESSEESERPRRARPQRRGRRSADDFL